MKNKIIDALDWRFAVQSFDTSKKVSEEDVMTILESARLAPSSFGLEAWKFIVVENPELRVKLRAVSYDQAKVTDASHLIVIARPTDARTHIVDDRIKRTAIIQRQDIAALDSYKQMLDGVIAKNDDQALDQWLKSQTYIALGVMIEAASLLGVDNAAMEGFDVAQVDEVLGLKEKHLTTTTMLALGYRGDDITARRPKVRKAFSEVVEFVK